MVYNTFIHNKRELDYIFARKLFKKHIFHNDYIEEEYYWDDYDTTYGHKMNTLANLLPKQLEKSSQTIPPLKKKPTMCLPRPPVKKILLTNSSTQTASNQTTQTTQTNPSCQTASTQTSPKFYFPRHRYNLNVAPYNTNLKN